MAQTISCPTCNQQYALKPHLAGKKAKCMCGAVFEFPAISGELDLMLDDPPLAAAASRHTFAQLEQTANPYQLSGGPKTAAPPPLPSASATLCRGCRSPLTPGALMCMSCGMNQKTGAILKTTFTPASRTLPVPPPAKHASGGSGTGMRNMLIGGGLVVVGLAITIGTYSAASERGGTYYVFYGPVIFGGIQFFKGLFQMAGGD